MKKYYILCLAIFFSCTGFAQQAFNSAGSTGLSGNFGLDWSVGELTLVQTVQNGGLVLTQGLLQGNILVFKSSPSSITDGELKILPNPTPGTLYLQTAFLQPGKLTMQLYNVAWQQLLTREDVLTGFSTKSINMSAYAAGTYLLVVSFHAIGGTDQYRSYKIIKL